MNEKQRIAANAEDNTCKTVRKMNPPKIKSDL